jgi:hypothetical protein
MRAQLLFGIATLIKRGNLVLGHHCDMQKGSEVSPWWSPTDIHCVKYYILVMRRVV